MARPKKDNADYFSHDADMRNDNKLKAVRRKFKNEGYAIWNMLLEHLTDCDFFEYEYNDLNIELLSGDFDIDPKLLKEMIDYFILLNLLILDSGYIKSLQLIKRFDSLLSKRKRDNNRVIANENPQSKVKESKVKESILKVADVPKKENAFNFRKSLIEYGLNENLVDDWLKVRKTKKASNTETAFKGFINQVELCSLDKNEILTECINRSWSGFKNSWLDEKPTNGTYLPNIPYPTEEREFMIYAKGVCNTDTEYQQFRTNLKTQFTSWNVSGWKDYKGQPIINWKMAVCDKIIYLRK